MRKIKLYYPKLKNIISLFILFGLIMQSGGGIIRTLSLVLCLGLVLINLTSKKLKVPNSIIIAFAFISASISISGIISAIQNVSIGSIISFNFSMYFLIILFFVAKTNYIDIKGYVKACEYFSIIVVILTIGTFLGLARIDFIKQKLIYFFNGIYGPKSFGGIVLWIAYFQGTLALIPACVYSLFIKKYVPFFICFLGILFSGSRFGLLVIVLFYCIFNYNKLIKVFFVIGIFVFIGYLTENPIIMSLFSMFDNSDGGVSIRSGHLRGIIELFEVHPSYLFWGQGPGSSFYSYGFKKYTDTCEISHFDFLRKYGIFFSVIVFSILLVFSYLLIRNTDKKGKGMGWAIIAHFILAISNPVLTSLPFMSFLTISITYYYSYLEKKRKQCKNISVQ